MDTIKLPNKGTVRMVAHRGCSGLERENTLPAFVAAANRSYFGIETDVHRTKDGKFVLHHDATTLRVTGVELPITETDFDTLRALPVLDKDGESTRIDLRLPVPEEYFSICHRYDKFAVFELKDNFTEEELKALCDVMESFGHMESTLFISFGLEVLVRLRGMRPDVNIQFLTKTFSDELLDTIANYGTVLKKSWLLPIKI